MNHRIRTDDNGVAEVISVAPGAYGLGDALRAGHFHVKIYPPQAGKGAAALDELTTQIYVCRANDAAILKSDL